MHAYNRSDLLDSVIRRRISDDLERMNYGVVVNLGVGI